MKFFMAQNEDGELRIASSSNNTTMDGDGWYEIDKENNFNSINSSNIEMNRNRIKQLIIPTWKDSRKKVHPSINYFLYNFNKIKDNTISEVLSLSYTSIGVKEVYRMITKQSSSINEINQLQYVDYSDTNTNKLVDKSNFSLTNGYTITIANNDSNLERILLGQDLFFNINIIRQNYSSKASYIYLNVEIYGHTTKEEPESLLFSTNNNFIKFLTSKNNTGTSLSYQKSLSISDLLTIYYNITRIIVKVKVDDTSANSSRVTSFICYLPYFDWVNSIVQTKEITGCYLQ